MPGTVYEFSAKAMNGKEISLNEFAGKVLLIVNTASKCGYTPHYKWMESMYQKYKASGLEVLGFPCGQFGNQEYGDDSQIESFCELNYATTFPLFSRVDVLGSNAHPLFTFLSDELRGLFGTKSIKWNFTKFLVGRDGRPEKRFAPKDNLDEIETAIRSLLVMGTGPRLGTEQTSDQHPNLSL